MRFPRLETRDLEGTEYVLPDGLPAGRRIIALPFLRWHQILVDGWERAIEPALAQYPDLTVWEVPALSKRWAAGRFYIDGGMRAGIPDKTVRRHTLTAYTDLRALVSALELPSTETAYVFLLDPDGEILWRGSGEVDDAQLEALAEALAASQATVAGE
jgi:hypothetical protein